ncbi:Short-chain dehydrogenase [Sphingomonas laterariae]|uniref:Short-chain dehydrogenase n=1 Tax=Edaphosphingomonas laterariae TaxID=861865 RepID=A0A239BE39_9SPHN|nr:SDR family oxidoreductase [Sphingomonas laterariae]SNS05313.1 Short-chain dehydrogenase [Sphingomonas laterariae]
MSVSGKTVIVTGAARNMGFHTAAALARRGARVSLWGRDAEGLAAAAASIGGDAMPIALDIADAGQIGEAMEKVAGHFGGIDGIVNNAGVAYPNTVENLDLDQLNEQIRINFLAPILTCRAVIPYLRARGGGRIVNVSSATVHRDGAFSFLSIYGATKAGLERFADELRHEVQKDDIGVTTFIPGDTATGFGQGWDEAVAGAAYTEWLERGPYWNGMMEVEAVGEQIAHCFDLPDKAAFEFVMMRPVGRHPKVMEGG